MTKSYLARYIKSAMGEANDSGSWPNARQFPPQRLIPLDEEK